MRDADPVELLRVHEALASAAAVDFRSSSVVRSALDLIGVRTACDFGQLRFALQRICFPSRAPRFQYTSQEWEYDRCRRRLNSSGRAVSFIFEAVDIVDLRSGGHARKFFQVARAQIVYPAVYRRTLLLVPGALHDRRRRQVLNLL